MSFMVSIKRSFPWYINMEVGCRIEKTLTHLPLIEFNEILEKYI